MLGAAKRLTLQKRRLMVSDNHKKHRSHHHCDPSSPCWFGRAWNRRRRKVKVMKEVERMNEERRKEGTAWKEGRGVKEPSCYSQCTGKDESWNDVNILNLEIKKSQSQQPWLAIYICEQNSFTNNVSWLGDPRLNKGRLNKCTNRANFNSSI